MHSGRRGAVFWCEKATYVHMPFIRCTKEAVYVCRLVKIVGGNSNLADDAPVIHSLDCVSFTRPDYTFHFLTNFGQFKKMISEQTFLVKKDSKLIFSWHCLDMFEILTRQVEESFLQVPSCWSSYEGSRLFFAPTPTMFAYHCSLPLLTERRSFFYFASLSLSAVCILSY